MLNWSDLFKYIKLSLGLPSGFIEKTDAEIKEWIILTTIPAFSQYFPDTAVAGIDVNQAKYRTDNHNVYKFFDTEVPELPIFDIRFCHFSQEGDLMMGHPIEGVWGMGELREWAVYVFTARFTKQFSSFNFTYKFIQPNKVRIDGYEHIGGTGYVAVEYEREQPHDLRKIPNAMKKDFMDLALADLKIQIGTIRTMYGDSAITTPFGDIPLRGDTLKQEGNELRDKIIDKLSDGSAPGIIIDIG